MSIDHDWSYTEIEPNISPGGVILQAPLCSKSFEILGDEENLLEED